MIHRYEQWSATGDPLVANDANVSIEPMQCDAGDPAEETINHLEPALEKLSGTLRNIHSASAIPIATVITPARYAKPVLQYFVNNFRRVTLLTFGRPLFPHLNESTVLLLAEGKATKEVAVRLNVSIKTIETHRRNLMEKLDLHSVAELTKYAIREGITSPEF